MTPNDQIVLLDATVPRWDDRSCAALRQALSVVGDGEVLEAPIALYVPTHNGEVLWEVTTSTRGKGLQLTNPEGRTLSRDEFVRHATRTKVTYERLPVTVLEEHEDGVTWDVQPTEAGFASTLVLQVRADKEGETWMRVELERFDPTRLVRPAYRRARRCARRRARRRPCKCQQPSPLMGCVCVCVWRAAVGAGGGRARPPSRVRRAARDHRVRDVLPQNRGADGQDPIAM